MGAIQDQAVMARRRMQLHALRARHFAAAADAGPLVRELDALRRLGATHERAGLVDLVHKLEALLARGGSRIGAQHYLAAIDDAILADTPRLPPGTEQALLASVAVRAVF